MMQKYRPCVLFISTLLSPFQVNTANEINRLANFDYHVGFTVPYSATRGKHWQSLVVDSSCIHYAPDNLDRKAQGDWAGELVKQLHPDIVILGMFRGPIYDRVCQLSSTINVGYGFWLEPSNFLLPRPIQWFIDVLARTRISQAKFVLAIGDRAERYFKKYVRQALDVHLVPYGQDLSLHYQIKRTVPTSTHFLFSGQLLRRHNIKLISEALLALHQKYPGQFKFTLAGYGPLESDFMAILDKDPTIYSIINYDRDYSVWEDRVKPFAYNDVLVYPSLHSGWGLVIPEAMAAGMIAISTRRVEAARYYIRHRVNGIFVKPQLNQLITEMEWCLHNRETVYRMGQRARQDARDGEAETVAKTFCSVIKKYL